MSDNVYWQKSKITKINREELLNQNGKLIWLTGLSGSGKSTIGSKLEEELYNRGKLTYMLDGDNLRHGLNSDLGFSENDRKENLRRVGEVGKILVDTGVIAIATFISPYEEERKRIRDLLKNDFIEIYIKCPLEICEKRDPKGLYKKVRNGEILNFTGVDSRYEEPINPDITINSNEEEIEESVEKILNYIFEIR